MIWELGTVFMNDTSSTMGQLQNRFNCRILIFSSNQENIQDKIFSFIVIFFSLLSWVFSRVFKYFLEFQFFSLIL